MKLRKNVNIDEIARLKAHRNRPTTQEECLLGRFGDVIHKKKYQGQQGCEERPLCPSVINVALAKHIPVPLSQILSTMEKSPIMRLIGRPLCQHYIDLDGIIDVS